MATRRDPRALNGMRMARSSAALSDVGTVAGATLVGLGTGLGQVSSGIAGPLGTAVPTSDPTPLYILGGVLVLGLVVYAVRK